jgi:acyl-CoA synthetase (AMP-forming)/AMP-acid ligase II
MTTPRVLPAQIETIPEAIAFWAKQTPHAPALILPGPPRRTITFLSLWTEAQGLAAALRGLGFERHHRVVLLVPEVASLAVALLGTMSAVIALPLNASLSVSALDAALQGFHADGVIVVPEFAPGLRQAIGAHGASMIELRGRAGFGALSLVGTTATDCNWDLPRRDDIAVVMQTSGTTGNPKRIPRGHGYLVERGRVQGDRLGLTNHDRAVAVAPLTLSLGMTTLFHCIVAGAALVVTDTFALREVWSAVAQERPTWMYASAGFLELLARFLRQNASLRAPSSFRFVRVSAAPISPAVCEELAQRLGAPILPSYSSSEAGAIAMALPPPAPYKPGSTGQPLQEIKIVDEHAIDVPRGAEGEIWVRRPIGFSGYLDDSELSASVLTAGGWFRTGDIGYLDGDGFLFLTGRISELINRGGDKISPAEVDAVLLAHPAVQAGAVFSVPDEPLGEDVVAAVVLADGQALLPRELRRWLLDRLAPHKVPRRVWFLNLDELPLTASGKVQRQVLRERFGELHAAVEASRAEARSTQ